MWRCLAAIQFCHVTAYLLSCAAQGLCHSLCEWQFFQKKDVSLPPYQKAKQTKVIQVELCQASNTLDDLKTVCIPFWN